MPTREDYLLNDIIKALVHDIAERSKLDEQQLSIIQDSTRTQLASFIRERMREEYRDGMESGKQIGRGWANETKEIAEAFVKKMRAEFLAGLSTCICLATAKIDWQKESEQ